MKESDFHNQISETLAGFDTLEYIEPSQAWEQTLMKRVSAKKSSSTSLLLKNKYVLVILFVALVNVGFILSTMLSSNSKQTVQRSNDLRTISKEFLINPSSINN